MNFRYATVKPLNGFTSITEVVKRMRVERTINWFLNGTVEPVWEDKLGHIENFKFIITKLGDI